MLGLHCDEIKLPTPAKQTATGHVQLPILWAPTSHNANRRSAGLIQHPIPAMYLLTSANPLDTLEFTHTHTLNQNPARRPTATPRICFGQLRKETFN